ncbi:endonuclease domain-containing protein [Parasphingorhabdus litoris]|uniref:Endonuclease domain-containing protein n=1 Tax=Parasphingorhabdus litoris TaxID=394733 RepID=A0ABP3K3T8_9SPHN
MRNSATPSERRLWSMLSQYRPRFTRQLVIDPYIVDFAHRKAKLIVELDGSQHVDQANKDRERTVYLEARGWRALRFWNSEVNENAEGVAQKILMVAAERLGGRELKAVPPRKRRVKREA